MMVGSEVVTMMRLALFDRCGRLATVVFLMVFLYAEMASHAAAQTGDSNALYDRLDRLERDIRTLNVQLSRSSSPARPVSTGRGQSADMGFARLSVRMDEIEHDVRAATGGMEQLNHRLSQIFERLEKVSSDIEYRLGSLEGSAHSVPPAASQPVLSDPSLGPARSAASVAGLATDQLFKPVAGQPIPSVADTALPGLAASPKNLGTVPAKSVDAMAKKALKAPMTPAQSANVAVPPSPTALEKSAPAISGGLPAGTVREQYTYALNLLRQTNYDQAEITLRTFIKAHGDNPLVTNARYWLGETYYVRAYYQQAAQVFYEGFRAAPQGPKAPDLLLKLGMSLGNLGKKTEACTTYQKVVEDYPNVSTGIRDALRRESAKSGCS